MPELQSSLLLAAESSTQKFVELGHFGSGPWIILGVAVVSLLILDLYRHRNAHEPTPKEAFLESAFWVACGLSFSVYVYFQFGAGAFGEYMSGYLIEKALSVDNVFVWSMLFTSMKIPIKYQHRVLFYGIFGALALRGVFIFAGTALLSRFSWLLYVFGAFLLYTGVKVLTHTDDEGEEVKTTGLGLLERFMPVTQTYDGQKFFTKVNGHRAATPLLAALVVVEATDVVFAVDSVPAILAVSHEEFLIFSSNAFAILGLRAMYFLLAGAKERFHYLNHGLGAILIFVGIKMLITNWYHMPVAVSLAVITALLAGAILFSIWRNKRLDEDVPVAG